MAIAIIGLTSAAGTSSIVKDELDPVMGYKQIESESVCEPIQECSNTGIYDCTAPDNSQLYAGSSSSCLVPLKRDTEH